MFSKSLITYLFSIVLFIFSCQNTSKEEKNAEPDTVVNSDAQWTSLSNKSSLDGWHIYQNKSGEKTGWFVENGVFTFNSELAKGEGNKSLITDQKYMNFEIQFEWKLSPESNSGFIWGVSEDAKYEHPHETGPEVQIIDAEVYGDNPDHQIHTAAALYDMIAPDLVMVKAPGEWNSYYIKIDHQANLGNVVHNGKEINRFPLHGPEWSTMVENSKFADMEGFGIYQDGYLCLQDHPGIISYRNIKIRQL